MGGKFLTLFGKNFIARGGLKTVCQILKDGSEHEKYEQGSGRKKAGACIRRSVHQFSYDPHSDEDRSVLADRFQEGKMNSFVLGSKRMSALESSP